MGEFSMIRKEFLMIQTGVFKKLFGPLKTPF
jgi:hypothetical protein